MYLSSASLTVEAPADRATRSSQERGNFELFTGSHRIAVLVRQLN